MRIVTWNCNGALRKKWHLLTAFDADIFVVQECEDPLRSGDGAYQHWACNHLWVGPQKNKGIGVFARDGINLTVVPMSLDTLQLFLPCLIDEMPLLAVWTKSANSPNFSYIGQLWKFLNKQKRKMFLDHPKALLIGDLNSNVRWDAWDRWWNHSDVVRELGKIGLRSLYHEHMGIEQGNEPIPTFYLQRNTDKPYHIDYAFAGAAWTVNDVHIGPASEWLSHSDHMPLMADIFPREIPMDPSFKPDPNLHGTYYRRIKDIDCALRTIDAEHAPPALQFASYFFGCEKLATAIIGIHKRKPAREVYRPGFALDLSEIKSASRALGLPIADADLDYLFAAYNQQNLLKNNPPHTRSARPLRNHLAHHFGPNNAKKIVEEASFLVPKMKDFLRCSDTVLEYLKKNFSNIP